MSDTPTRATIEQELENANFTNLDTIAARNTKRHQVIVGYLNSLNIPMGEKEKILSDLSSYQNWEKEDG